jgi:glycosyltransferase involved in cell wall biosynthesis
MADSPLVSVVVASFNMARYLPATLRSALGQTYSNVEVIVVDDGSTDDTPAVMESFLKDPRVRYVPQRNGGQASAKNRGIRESRGEFVAFLDSDDLWAPDKLALQIPLFLRSGSVGVVYARYVEIDAEGNEGQVNNNVFHRGLVSGPLLVFNFIGFSTSVVRRECFETLGVFRDDLGMGIDYDLWLRFSPRYEFDYVDRPLMYYRVWAGQMSNNCQRRYQNGMRIMGEFLAQHGGAVSSDWQRLAWAHTYAGYADCLRRMGSPAGAVLAQYLEALRRKPGYVPAWKGVVKLCLGRK